MSTPLPGGVVLPSHWDARRLKHMCSLSAAYGANEPASNYMEEGVRFLRTTDILSDGSLTPPVDGVYLPPEKTIGYILQDGDLLLSRSGTIGKSFRFDQDRHGLCAYAGYLVRFRAAPEHDPRFLFYFTKSRLFEDQISADAIETTIANFSGQKYANMVLPAPPPDDQQAIADFLDEKTAAIDALIAKKERVIELIEEKRQAAITRAVTKGLDPDVPMKDSGVEWLGEVLAHWTVAPLRHLAQCLDGRRVPLNASERGEMQGPYPYWGANGIVDRVDRWLFDEPLVLLGEDGAPFFDPLKPVAFFVAGKIWVNNHIHVIRAGERIRPHFLAHALNSTDYANFVDGTTRDKLTQGKMKEIPIPLPPHEEQVAVESVLHTIIERGVRVGHRLNRQIERLRDYRQTLISAAVTGQIDVRRKSTRTDAVLEEALA